MPWLESRYETLDDSIPLDRAIKAAGYRSIRQFALANGMTTSLVCNWRNGKPSQDRDSLLAEMTAGGFSLNLRRLMSATGCLEWELFPDLFTADFYDALNRGAAVLSGGFSYTDRSVETRELKRIVRQVVDTLPPRMARAVKLAYGLEGGHPMTFRQIGRLLRLTGERARHIVLRALRRLVAPDRLRLLSTVSLRSTLASAPLPAALALHNRLCTE